MRTAQELFDISAEHLLRQGRKCISPETGSCAYRGLGGTMCAVGALIPDDAYTPAIEGIRITTVLDRKYLPSDIDRELAAHRPLLRELQIVHDHAPVDRWAHELRVTANDFGLDHSIIVKTCQALLSNNG